MNPHMFYQMADRLRRLYPETTIVVPEEPWKSCDLNGRMALGIKKLADVLREWKELESAEDFADGVEHARQEVEQAFQTQQYSTPERTIARLARALAIDPETGRMASKWKRDEERAKAKKAKKK